MDDAAFSTYAPALRRFFQRRVPASDAEDLLHDVFLAMYARRPATAVGNVQAYLFTSARHALYKYVRHAAQTQIQSEIPETADDAPLQDRDLFGRIELDHVLRAVIELPPRTKSIFIMHRFENLSYPDIARHLGISVSAVEKHIMSALRQLLKSMRDR